MQGDVLSPALQHDVADGLDRLGWTHTFENQTAERLSVDTAKRDTKGIVEIYGSNHHLFVIDGDDRDDNVPATTTTDRYSSGWTEELC